jgi:hypothetical protein
MHRLAPEKDTRGHSPWDGAIKPVVCFPPLAIDEDVKQLVALLELDGLTRVNITSMLVALIPCG